MRLFPLFGVIAGLALTAQALSAAEPAADAGIDFVRPTDFKYGQWRSAIIGGGGYVQNVVPCLSNKNRFYTYVDVAGLSRSDDGGKSWRMLHGALPGQSGNNSVRGLIVDPRDDNKILVATGGDWARRGVWYSEDAGNTFKQVLEAQYFGNGAGRAAGFILDRSPQDPNFVITASVKDGVFISKDNGLTWTPSADNVKGLYPNDIRFDKKNPQRLWLCASKQKATNGTWEGGFFRSDDGGATWTKLADQSPSEIIQDPKDGSILGIFGAEIIRRSTDGGETWTDFSDGLIIEKMPEGKWKEAISKSGYGAIGAGPDFIVTCNRRDADVFRLASGSSKWEKINRSAPEVGDWFHKGGWAFGGASGSLTVDPHNPDHWFITDYFAIYQTFDAGKTWRLTVDGLETTVAHCMLQDPSDPGVVHVGLADVGAFTSVDGGTRFRKDKVPDDKDVKDADAGGGNMKCMDLCPKLPNRIYGVANRNWFVLWQANQVFVSNDRGQTWSRSPQVGLPDTGKQPCTTIVSDVNDPYTVYVTVAGQIADGGGGVYKSTDGGARWTAMNDGLPKGAWYFPFDIWAHGRQMAASGDGSLVAISKQGNLIFRFDPATQKWAKVDMNRQGSLWCIVADKLKPGRYFIATRDGGIYRSDDGGIGWKKVYDGGTSFVAVDNAVPNRVAAGTTKNGVILSLDGGATWKVVSDGLPDKVDDIPGFAGDRLFVATGGSGVFWMPITPSGEKGAPAKTLVAANAPVAGALPTLVNLNGDAPGDTVPGWKTQAVPDGEVLLARDTAMKANDGEAAVRIDSKVGGSVFQEWDSNLYRFRIRGSVRAKGGVKNIKFSLIGTDQAGQPVRTLQLRDLKSNNAWWDGVNSLVTLPPGISKLKLECSFEGDGKIWLDNFSLSLPDTLYPQ